MWIPSVGARILEPEMGVHGRVLGTLLRVGTTPPRLMCRLGRWGEPAIGLWKSKTLTLLAPTSPTTWSSYSRALAPEIAPLKERATTTLTGKTSAKRHVGGRRMCGASGTTVTGTVWWMKTAMKFATKRTLAWASTTCAASAMGRVTSTSADATTFLKRIATATATSSTPWAFAGARARPTKTKTASVMRACHRTSIRFGWRP